MKHTALLLLILGLGVFLRFFLLVEVPPSLSHDEVAIGYNAYSILKTGKDEYRQPFPLLFRSFDDYKLPGMIYATVPSVALWGLTEFGVRFPSALFGSIALLVFYAIVKFLLREEKTSFGSYAPILITLFFAISPWHINFSRQSFESNGALLFFMIGTYFLLLFGRKSTFLILSAIFYALSVYFYYSVRPVLPIVLLVFCFIYKDVLLRKLKITVVAGVVGLIFLVPLFPSLFSSGGLSRIQMVSVVNDPSFVDRRDLFAQKRAAWDNPLTKMLYNSKTALIITSVENYLKNLSLKYIFVNGTDSAGLLYLFELPFFFYGMYVLAHFQSKSKWLIFAWFFASPLAGAFTISQPNALRTLIGAPTFSLFSGLGVTSFLVIIRRHRFNNIIVAAGILVLLGSFLKFSYLYWYFVPRTKALDFSDGHKQMVHYVLDHEREYEEVYISGYWWRPYIFFLFWSKFDPRQYQLHGSVEQIGKYSFTGAEWDLNHISLYNSKFKLEDLSLKDPSHTLFLLALPEYNQHRDIFTKIESIDGRYAKNVFVAARMTPISRPVQ